MRVLLLAFSVSETCFIPSDYSVVIIQMYLQELLACCCIKTGRYASVYCTLQWRSANAQCSEREEGCYHFAVWKRIQEGS